MLTAECHLGSRNCDPNMRRYIWRRRNDGVHIINLGKTWEKLVLAARIIVGIENPEDVVVVSARQFGQRAVFKFAQHTGSAYVGGRYTPGTFTNQTQKKFMEPRLLLATDPGTDSQPIMESSYACMPVVAFCDSDSPLNYVDIAIPCNNKSKSSIALMYWLLAREVLRMRSALSRAEPWNVMVDLFLYRDPDEKLESEKTDEEPIAEPVAEVAAEAVPEYGGKVVEWGADEVAPAAETGFEAVPVSTDGAAAAAAAPAEWQANWQPPAQAAPAAAGWSGQAY